MTTLALARVDSCALVLAASLLFISSPTHAESGAGQGVIIYSRPVPSQPAQVRGEPAPPGQVVLSGPGSAWDSAAVGLETLTDGEAAQIGAPLHTAQTALEGGLGALDQVTGAGAGGSATPAVGLAGGLSGAALTPLHGALGQLGPSVGAAVNAATSQGNH